LDIEEELGGIAKNEYLNNKRLLWFRCDTHMNEIGAKYTSVIIEKFLKDIRKK
jgi:hypothetical protein